MRVGLETRDERWKRTRKAKYYSGEGLRECRSFRIAVKHIAASRHEASAGAAGIRARLRSGRLARANAHFVGQLNLN
jgi:hypothetical protein